MVYKWKLQKSITKSYRCPECSGSYPLEEFSLKEDLCLTCLYPQASGKRILHLNFDYGDPKNISDERILLDNLPNISEKQGPVAAKSLDRYKNRKLYKS